MATDLEQAAERYRDCSIRYEAAIRGRIDAENELAMAKSALALAHSQLAAAANAATPAPKTPRGK